MKTKHYYMLTAFIFMGYTVAKASGQEVRFHKMPAIQMKTLSPKDTDQKTQNEALYTAINSIFEPGAGFSNILFQNIKKYNISGKNQVVKAFVPEPLASGIGYMGFKVGDRVEWGSAVDYAVQKKFGTSLTGTIDMLDSDRCYILVDHSNRVAVKPYENLSKLNH